MPNLEAVTSLPHRPDAWSVNNAHCTARYHIVIEAEADSLCRLLNLFAMQYLIPQRVNVVQEDHMLTVEVQIDGLTWHRAQVIGEKMRSLINVSGVDLEQIAQPHALHSAVSLVAG